MLAVHLDVCYAHAQMTRVNWMRTTAYNHLDRKFLQLSISMFILLSFILPRHYSIRQLINPGDVIN